MYKMFFSGFDNMSEAAIGMRFMTKERESR
jgi:hypothetical protein